MRTNLPMKALWCFDFDGVVCHSAKELYITAWSAAKRLWPDQTSSWPDRPGNEALEDAYRVRPVVETGWEAMVINRALQNKQHDTETILRDYTSSLRDQLLDEYGIKQDDYLNTFCDVRSEWMTKDEEGWIAENEFYPGAVEGIKYLLAEAPKISADGSPSSPATRPPVFVITTKGKEFTMKLLKGAGLEDVPEDHVYGLGSGKKVDVLNTLLDKYNGGAGGDTRVTFMEDRLQTLLGVLEKPAVKTRADLLLAGWGYNTKEERDHAAEHKEIEVIPTDEDFFKYVERRVNEQRKQQS